MKTFRLIFFSSVVALLFAACGGEQAVNRSAADNSSANQAATNTQPSAATLEQARSDYGNFCIRCHKQDGTGGRVELDDGVAIDVANLRARGRRDSDEELVAQIRNGGDGMPPFKNRLSDERINGLVSFIRAEFHGRGASEVTPSSPVR